MFVIEKLISDHRAGVAAWETARDKWIDEDQSMYGNYRTKRDYARKHPRPGSTFFAVSKGVAISMLIATVAIGGSILIVHTAKSNQKSEKTETVQVSKDKNCQHLNVGDYVRIQYGDYEDKKGTVIGGCNPSENYQVKLDDNQMAEIQGDGIEDPVDVSNRLLSVDSIKNLVVIHEPKTP